MLKMAPIPLFVLFFLARSVLPSSAEEEPHLPKCPPVLCGNHSQHDFPFDNMMTPQCGGLRWKCSKDGPRIQLKPEGHWYRIENVISQPHSIVSIIVKDKAEPKDLLYPCKLMNEYSLPSPTDDSSHFSSDKFTAENSSTLYKCSHSHRHKLGATRKDLYPTECGDYDFYCSPPGNTSIPSEQQCQNITLPFSLLPPLSHHHDHHPDHPLLINVTFRLNISLDCFGCDMGGGECHNTAPENQFQCTFPQQKVVSGLSKQQKLGLEVGLGFGFGVVFTIIGLAIIIWRRKRKRAASRNMVDPYMNMEGHPERTSSGDLGVLVFSYKQLAEATDNFNAEKILGHGNSGAVYHGKLKDGREVAVKRLYEHNYKRVREQFQNEIEILTRLRHKNLVSLYGCTSRHCQELLLVYEYIPNGTVADHLHGDRAKTSPLTWPIRLSIAIETASALVYLHASDVVHRDVQTNNILLDNNFCVKVADFGLSRLFPIDVTHVSTAPQGTPGYVDPEYYQCYQLTSKSDVYSFGVVLMELLSSMPAIDMTRHRREIYLANLAISKIQTRAYNELIDQNLGFDSDTEVRTMTIAVAELAFECLQQDKEMRPTMDEVLERLRRIKDGKI
ncbi:LEAF RUST 10 DISEASE-RESISTANCE LOCUS RECEPTOR-LIKE PROTEIN KINASE-like 1.1 [Humulus lupulus]|uniref:LEAF RUST 10 DISEASE-RESISTANCE LOCUS RECEPTOR-LIKE PROTEIN KINASE-like 1.1 n=1 Tax=Humulus lupulus TaxID=3486 RepID=UPI002B40DFAF|nr:LEAF RUST 10 DISEASE-RESISTANCE LOCUS RECEPTOR-LIKE PROTEIN KINASE-like 1.1 [Humulus lupulus]